MDETENLPSAPSASSGLPALRDADPKLILHRYLSDESTKDIANSYGVTRQALGRHMLKHLESEWREAQVARALARKESAEDDLEAITAKIEGADREQRERLALTVSLARERLKSAQWDLERVCRRIYGQDVTPDQLGRVSIVLNIGVQPQQSTESGVVIEGEVSK